MSRLFKHTLVCIALSARLCLRRCTHNKEFGIRRDVRLLVTMLCHCSFGARCHHGRKSRDCPPVIATALPRASAGYERPVGRCAHPLLVFYILRSSASMRYDQWFSSASNQASSQRTASRTNAQQSRRTTPVTVSSQQSAGSPYAQQNYSLTSHATSHRPSLASFASTSTVPVSGYSPVSYHGPGDSIIAQQFYGAYVFPGAQVS